MKVCRPAFYKEFQCIGSECKDTCCALWEIEVDEYSAERYAKEEGPLAEDLRKYLVRKEDENYFRLTEDKRCPFLNEQNLCRMILTMGEDALCDICREHPRFYHWFGDYTEVGLGLCCEEAGRFLFSQKEPIAFELLSDEDAFSEEDAFPGECEEADNTEEQYEGTSDDELEEPYDDDPDDEYEEIYEDEEDFWISLLLEARSRVFDLLQDRLASLNSRIQSMLAFAEGAQPYLDEEDADGFEEYLNLEQWSCSSGKGISTGWDISEQSVSALKEMLSFYGKLESLNHGWPEHMARLQQELPQMLESLPVFEREIEAAGRETEFENLAVYFVFRYFMEAVFDSNLLSPIRFAAVSLRMIGLLDLYTWYTTGAFSMADQIQNAKWYSKEIEYCPDNMEVLTEKLEVDDTWL